MIVTLALVLLVPCNQVEDDADRQHLTWTSKVLLLGVLVSNPSFVFNLGNTFSIVLSTMNK